MDNKAKGYFVRGIKANVSFLFSFHQITCAFVMFSSLFESFFVGNVSTHRRSFSLLKVTLFFGHVSNLFLPE